MNTTNKALIAILAVLLLLMPTSAVAVTFVGEDAVGVASFVSVENEGQLEAALSQTSNDVVVKVNGSFSITKEISVYGVHRIESVSDVTISRDSNYKGVMLKVMSGAIITIGGNITFDGNNVKSAGSILFVSVGATVSMEGNVVITRSNIETSDKNIGTITVEGSFTMNGGEICNNKTNNVGGGLTVYGSDASFTMNGGTISGNTALNGGGVRLNYGAIFTMNSGNIIGNMALNPSDTDSGNGGGIAVASSIFVMNGGMIADNSAVRKTVGGFGSGVYLFYNIAGKATYFYMYGGEITGNYGYGSNTSNKYEGHGDQIYSNGNSSIATKMPPILTFAGGVIAEKEIAQGIEDKRVGSAVYILGSYSDAVCIGKMTGSLTITGDFYYSSNMYFSRTDTLNVTLDLVKGTVSSETAIIRNGCYSNDLTLVKEVFVGNIIEIVGHDTVYVSDNGSDTNSGFNSNAPLKTLDAAFDILSLSGSSTLTLNVVGECTISSNSTVSISKTMFVSNGMVIAINGCSSMQITRDSSSGDYLFDVYGTLTLNGITVDGKDSSKEIIHVNSNSFFNIDKDTIIQNNKYAAIASWGTTTVDGKITGCKSSTSNISAITVVSGETHLNSNSEVYENTATGNGGAIFIQGGKLFIDGSKIHDNTASNNAGAIRVQGGTATMDGGEIYGNKSLSGNASAVSVSAGEFTFNGGYIYNNNAASTSNLENKGRGAVHVFCGDKDESTFTMNGGYIYDNTSNSGATYNGGLTSVPQVFVSSNGKFNLNGGLIHDAGYGENYTSSGFIVSGSMIYSSSGVSSSANIDISSGYEHKIKLFCGAANKNGTPQSISSIEYVNLKPFDGAGVTKLTATYSDNTISVDMTVAMNAYYSAKIVDGNNDFNYTRALITSPSDVDVFTGISENKSVRCSWYKANEITTTVNGCTVEIAGNTAGIGYAYDGDTLTITATAITESGKVTNILVNNIECSVAKSGNIGTSTYTVGLSDINILAISDADKATITFTDPNSTTVPYGYSGANIPLIIKSNDDTNYVISNDYVIITNGFKFSTVNNMSTITSTGLACNIAAPIGLAVGTYDVSLLITNYQGSICFTSFTFTVEKVEREAPAVTVVNGNVYGVIAGITSEMEISYNNSSFVAAEPTSNGTIGGLLAGTYMIRYAADDNYEASASTVVVIGIGLPSVIYSAENASFSVTSDSHTIVSGSSVEAGTVIEITVTADVGYRVGKIIINGAEYENSTMTFTVTTNTIISATLIEVSYDISVDDIIFEDREYGYGSPEVKDIVIKNIGLQSVDIIRSKISVSGSFTILGTYSVIESGCTSIDYKLTYSENIVPGTYVATLSVSFSAGDSTITKTADVSLTITGESFSATVEDADGNVDGRTIYYTVGSGDHTFNIESTGDVAFMTIDSTVASGFEVNDAATVITFNTSEIAFSASGCFTVTLCIGDDIDYSEISFFLYIIPENEFIVAPSIN